MSEPQMLFGLSPDPDSPTPTLIPRMIAEQILQASPAMAMALGITPEALRTGALGPASATPADFPELRTLRASVREEDVPTRVVRTLRQQEAVRRMMPKPSMGPADALRLHGELRSSLVNEGMHKWMGVWLTGFKTDSLPDAEAIPREVEFAGLTFATSLRESLREAETYLVAADANPLLTAAAESLPWTMAFQPWTPPSPTGFLAFAAPYELSDSAGNVMRIRAVTWETSGLDPLRDTGLMTGWPEGIIDGLLLTFWGEVDDPPPLSAEEAKQIAAVRKRLGTNLVIAQTIPVPLGVPLIDWPMFRLFLERGGAEGITGPVSLAMATWMLMKQPVISVGRGHMPPKLRKELRKKGRIRGNISVVNLRQRPPSAERLPAEGEAARREYHFRWTVKGHWRNQACGPGRREHEWIYIFAHVKGPADKPLRQRQRVYRVSGRP